MAQVKRPITAEDLYRIQTLSDSQLSPDGRHIICCVERVDRETEKKYTNLWLVPTGNGRPRQFTYGNQKDHHPRWSPDGRTIAFLSNREDEKQEQIYLIPVDGGEARPLTGLKGNFGSIEWSPDRKQLVCEFRLKDKEAVEREEDKRKRELGVVARHITRLDYRLDGVGYLPQERWHIWTINARTGKAKQLTSGPTYDETMPRWSPDGREILFFSNRSQRPDIDTHLIDLYAIPAAGGALRKIETPAGPKSLASYSPDGRWIAYVGTLGDGDWWQNNNVWLVPADGSAPAQNLTGVHDIEVASETLTDTGNRPLLPPAWSPDGRQLAFQVSRHGETRLCSLPLGGRDLHTLVAGGVVGSFGFDADWNRLCYFHSSFMDLGQLWLQSLEDGRPAPKPSHRLTDFNRWLRRVDLGQIEEVWYKGQGGNDLQGWILKPPGFDESKQYPSILEIHGGPWAQYGNAFMHEFYFLAAHGYVVYFTNPRGGQGYGEDHSKAIHRTWGRADYADLMAWADHVAALPYIDPERMGVTGGSYGGYMTTWIIGHTNRFKAAVAQRVVSNAVSFWGSSDVGYLFEDTWNDRPPYQDLDPYWEQSPIKYIGNAATPTLLIHSEQDFRCAQEQAEQVFIALRQQGVDTELVLFPESSHGLSRDGRTDRRIVRLNHILRWFEKYLKS